MPRAHASRLPRGSGASAVCLFLLAGMLGGCGSANAPASPPSTTASTDGDGVLGEWVSAAGYQRTYSLHLPSGYDASRPYPLIIAFHGAGGTHEQAHDVGLDRAANAGGFILAAPDGIGGDWSLPCAGCTYATQIGVDDVAFVATLVNHLSRNLSIDPNGVFVAGISDGGAFTHEVACRYPVAGAAVVAGMMFDPASCHPPKRVPFVGFHGTADGVVAFSYATASVQEWAALNGCADIPSETNLPDLVANDQTTVIRYDFPACSDDADVTFFAILGGGHNWPGVTPWNPSDRGSKDINASDEIVRFFSAHRR